MKAFFKRVNELVRDGAIDILDVLIEEGIEIRDKEWAERMIAIQKQRNEKKIQQDDDSEEEEEEEEENEIPEPLEDEVRVDAPAMAAARSYLFRKATLPYRMRLVTPAYSITY